MGGKLGNLFELKVKGLDKIALLKKICTRHEVKRVKNVYYLKKPTSQFKKFVYLHKIVIHIWFVIVARQQTILNLFQVGFFNCIIKSIDITTLSGLSRQKIPNLGDSRKKRIHVAFYWGKGAFVGKAITTLSCESGFGLCLSIQGGSTLRIRMQFL